MQVGQIIETSNGWLLDVEKIVWWSSDDGAVYGKALAASTTKEKWTQTKYLGTVKGLSELAVMLKV